MKTFKLDSQGDLIIDGGDLQSVTGDNELMQCVWLTLNINKGEWFLDNELGLDYSVFMDDKFYDKSKIARAIEDAILQESRVVHAEVTKVHLNKESRKLYVEAYMRDERGKDIKLSEVIEIG